MIELYRFDYGSTVYRYTSADRDVTYDEETWTAIPIDRSDRVRDTSEDTKNLVTIPVAHDNEVARLFLQSPPDVPVRLRLYRGIDEESITLALTATVTGVKWSGYEATIECESPMIAAARNGLRARYQSQCRHAVYSRGCGVDPEDFTTTFTFVALELNGRRVKVTGTTTPAEDYHAGGALTIDGEIRTIVANISGFGETFFDIDRPFSAPITVGATVEALAGCEHSVEMCRDRFSNIENFGGFTAIPKVNPFERRLNLPTD
jgi:uncharacterized phage protein (TIGR02218 family)